MLMDLGERFNVIDIQELWALPKTNSYQWVAFFEEKAKRVKKAKAKAKNKNGSKN